MEPDHEVFMVGVTGNLLSEDNVSILRFRLLECSCRSFSKSYRMASTPEPLSIMWSKRYCSEIIYNTYWTWRIFRLRTTFCCFRFVPWVWKWWYFERLQYSQCVDRNLLVSYLFHAPPGQYWFDQAVHWELDWYVAMRNLSCRSE